MKTFEGQLVAGNEKFCIILSRFNDFIGAKLLSGAIDELRRHGVDENNIDVVMEVINFIYENIMYAELNTKSDYCQKCGYNGEILLDDDLEWYCPECGNRDHDTLNVARRTCGYIGTNFWNKGRTQEIKERVVHIDNKDDE